MGVGVVVAILDTGIDATHPALAGKVMVGFNFITNSSMTADVGDGIDTDKDDLTDEMVGHGTFTAGLVHLVAPQAQLLPVTVLNPDGIGDGFIIAKGMFFAIDQGVEVINMSLGSTYKSQAVEDATDEAEGWGIVVVGAAGNFDTNEVEEFPAFDNGAFGIVATDHEDIKASFSNYGEDLTISAPGTRGLPAGPARRARPDQVRHQHAPQRCVRDMVRDELRERLRLGRRGPHPRAVRHVRAQRVQLRAGRGTVRVPRRRGRGHDDRHRLRHLPDEPALRAG